MRPMGNINGENGQTGALRERSVTASTTLVESDGGRVLEADPAAAGGALTITLPADSCGPGYFTEVMQVSAGTVVFAPAAGTSIDSAAGATQLTQQWTSARMRRRETGTWALEGALS